MRADLNGVVVPVRRLAVVAGRAAAALVLDRINVAVLFFDQIQLSRDAQPFGAELDTAGVQGVAFLAGAVLQAGGWVALALTLRFLFRCTRAREERDAGSV